MSLFLKFCLKIPFKGKDEQLFQQLNSKNESQFLLLSSIQTHGMGLINNFEEENENSQSNNS